MNTPDNTREKLTKDIYEAMQISYLSERHDAIKNLIYSEITKAKLELLRELSEIDGKTSNSFEDFYDGYQSWVEAKRKELEEIDE